jgi:hypothetical protein
MQGNQSIMNKSQITTNPQGNARNPVESGLLGAALGTGRRSSMSQRFHATMNRLPLRHPLAYEFLCELRSFLLRTKILLFHGTVALADIGPAGGVARDGILRGCSRTHGRRQDIQRFLGFRPWASREEQCTFLAGWNSGARWVDHNPDHSCISQSNGCIAPCMDPANDFTRWMPRAPKRKKRKPKTSALDRVFREGD